MPLLKYPFTYENQRKSNRTQKNISVPYMFFVFSFSDGHIENEAKQMKILKAWNKLKTKFKKIEKLNKDRKWHCSLYYDINS